MNRLATLLIAVVTATALIAAPALGAAPSDAGVSMQVNETVEQTPQQDNATDNTNESAADDIGPGAHLSGVLAVTSAEVDGEIDSRAFGMRVADAANNDSKAKVVGDQLQNVDERLTDLEERKAELKQARANGTISDAKYTAEMARLNAETKTAKQLANQSEQAAKGLPSETLEANGVNATAIQTLKDRAGNLSGPEVAAIAQTITGPGGAGNAPGDDRLGNANANGTDDGNATPGSQGPDNRPGDQPVDDNQVDENETSTENTTETPRDGDDSNDDRGGQ